ncbi:MAG TPA: hypothetical protein VFM54_23500 [Micromonosporaceae bacterium]|nr:hypothetical protein [Micromonosporaceae bacterium]
MRQRVLADLRHWRNFDLYATALTALVFTALTLVGADLSDDLRWSLVFAALGLLVLRVATATVGAGTSEDILLDRTAFVTNPINERLRRARQVWIFAPTGENLLNHERCALLRKGPLSRPDGEVRIAVLDESDAAHFAVVVQQLDRLLEYPVQQVSDALRETHQRLANMAKWQVQGACPAGRRRNVRRGSRRTRRRAAGRE